MGIIYSKEKWVYKNEKPEARKLGSKWIDIFPQKEIIKLVSKSGQKAKYTTSH